MVNALGSGWLVAIAVAVLPALFGVIGSLVGREARAPQEIRNISHLADTMSKIPLEDSAHGAMGELLVDYVESIKPKLVDSKRLNRSNVALSVVLIVVTLVIMYFLISWVNVSGAWNVAAVIVTVIVGLGLFTLNAASVSTWYNPPSPAKSEPGR
jgi:hypothetical protein